MFEGAGKAFLSEARAAARRGIRLYAMTNTAGKTWDIGVIPYEPVPRQWMKRYDSILQTHRQLWPVRHDGVARLRAVSIYYLKAKQGGLYPGSRVGGGGTAQYRTAGIRRGARKQRWKRSISLARVWIITYARMQINTAPFDWVRHIRWYSSAISACPFRPMR